MGKDIIATAPPWIDVPFWHPIHVSENKLSVRERFTLDVERIIDLQKVTKALASRSLEGSKE